MSAVVFADFRPDPERQNRRAAGAAALKRAREFGYSRTFADALRRTAYREWFPGETPETTAHRIVRQRHQTTVPSGPGSAA